MITTMYLVPALGLLGLLVMIIRAVWVVKQPAGDANMKELAGYIADGALAFLKAEWRVLAIFVALASALLAWSGTLVPHSDWVIAVAFIIGAFFSAFAGWIGMNIATKANVRTTQAARTSLAKALQVSFTGGAVMGLGVAGLAVLGLSLLFAVFFNLYDAGANSYNMQTALEVLAGFSLGAESIALFARVGGGIYTKAADVGADLVGKVEAGIPEDDPRNPATIADNVGDNVGDVAGMGADLFGSYVATILATMVLGREVLSADSFNGIAPILLPMVIAGLGLVFSIVATFLVRIKNDNGNVQQALNMGNWGSIVLTAIASYFVVMYMLPAEMSFNRGGEEAFTFSNMDVFWSIVVGLAVGAIMSIVTEYYTSMGRRPVNNIVQQSGTGHATNIIGGLAIGMESTAIPILVLAAGIFGSYALAGLYGVAIAAAGMMATTAMQLAIDAFGPIADNAGGIAEMSGLPKEVRNRTDILDAVGNTTAATGKGFAIASAALTALALFAAYVGIAGITSIDIYKAEVLAMLFVGGMIPFLFSSLAISAVGRAAMAMVKEVRRQFKEIPGIMEGTGKPQYERCVEISTQASIREMIAPGSLALIAPAVVGFAFGPEALGGLLAGITVSGVLMGIFQNNAGGAWDNAKKSFEKGVLIDGKMEYKGSEPHKASVTGDTVGDPFKDTSGPSMNILIKLTSIVALIIAPHIAPDGTGHGSDAPTATEVSSRSIETTSGSFIIDPSNSEVVWSARKVTGAHYGHVPVSGKAQIENGYVRNADITIALSDLTVDDIQDAETNAQLVGHLKSPDFFNVEEHPRANFRIAEISGTPGKGSIQEFKAEMTIKGITKPVKGTLRIDQSSGQPVAEGKLSFDRTDFDIRYGSGKFFDDLGDNMIYDEVNVKFSVRMKEDR